MDDRIRSVLDARLRTPLSRRRFLIGTTGLTALTILGTRAHVAAQSAAPALTPQPGLGGKLNFVGYDGEDARNVAKPFFEETGITMNPTYIADPFEPLTRFQTGGRGQMDIIADNKDFMRSRPRRRRGALPAARPVADPQRRGALPGLQGGAPGSSGRQDRTPSRSSGVTSRCVYDPDRVADGPPAKYTDFADPKYAGELVHGRRSRGQHVALRQVARASPSPSG